MSGDISNEIKMSELENEAKDISLKIKELKSYYENNFQKNNIDIKHIETFKKDDNIDENIKKDLKSYSDLKNLEETIDNKLIFYEKMKMKYEDLDTSIVYKEKKIDEKIEEIKKGINNIAKLVKMSNIFKNYTEDLLSKIKMENEYKDESEIFNKDNINNFKITDFYAFLNKNLCSKEYKFSIIKRDITKYNLYAVVVENFHELIVDYKENLDIEI